MMLDSSRVVRTFGVLFGILAGALFAVYRVLSVVGGMANELVGKAIARYSSFTGKMALENFPEDKALYAKVKGLQATVLPALDVAQPIIITLAIILVVVALLCLILPRQIAQVLVAIKIWKGAVSVQPESVECACEKVSKPKFEFSFVHKMIAAVVALIVILVLLGISFANRGIPLESVSEELASNSENFVTELKATFQKTKGVGITPEFEDSEIFDYAPKKGGFTATLKQDVDGCPAGSVWKISSEVKGLFSKSLSIYRKAPADTACAKILPNFKNIGK